MFSAQLLAYYHTLDNRAFPHPEFPGNFLLSGLITALFSTR